MHKILFVTKSFYPHGNGTSDCVSNIIDILRSIDIECDILALTTYRSDLKVNKWKDSNIHFSYIQGGNSVKELMRMLSRGEFKDAIIGTSQKIYSIVLNLIHRESRHLHLNYIYLRAYRRSLYCLSTENYDAIITTLLPIEACCAVIESDLKCKKYIYQLDPYWNNQTFISKYSSDRLSYEKRMIGMYDSIFTLPLLINSPINGDRYCSKYIELEFPMIKKIAAETDDKWRVRNTIACVFLGKLYPDIRPPDLLVEIISKLVYDDIEFYFYGSGLDTIVKSRYYSTAKEIITLGNQVSSSKAKEIMISADFLVNIDNRAENQVPSKIFEYMSTGLPILNFYFNKQSETSRYLSKYPLSISLKLDSVNLVQNANSLVQYIHQNLNKRVPFTTVQNMYHECTPEYVARKMISAIYSDELKGVAYV
ncbi:hypothetical protein AGMMS49992_29970 [Clostridia bacterium]|nr:hypothetical protein AGMMS49992_29970 [Clostridia bacterium]